MTTEIEGTRGQFHTIPFAPEQLEVIQDIEHREILVNPERVRTIIDNEARTGYIDPTYFRGDINVNAFEEDPYCLPPNISLLLTGKGWDAAIKERLVDASTGGSSRGSKVYSSEAPLEAILGFVSLIPLPDNRESYEITTDLIHDNQVVVSDIIQPRACTVEDDLLYLVAENNAYAINQAGNSRSMHHELLGTTHDVSFFGEKMAIASSDTDQVVVLDKSSGAVLQIISMIDHGYHLSIGNLTGIEQNGFYVFPDQITIADRLISTTISPSNIKTLLVHRDAVEKVPTREQTTHINSVQFLDANTMLATLFNSAVVDSEGNMADVPGGKIISITTTQQEGFLGEMLSNNIFSDSSDWDIVVSNTGYETPDNQGYCHKTYYCKDRTQSVVMKEVADQDGKHYTNIERVATVESGLRNPHSIFVLSEIDEDNTFLGVSNTSAGEILFYELQKSTEHLRRVGSLNFRDLPGASPDNNHWIHYVVPPTLLPNSEHVITVYDGSRKGIHVVNLTTQKRMFIPVGDNPTVYQTQPIVTNPLA